MTTTTGRIAGGVLQLRRDRFRREIDRDAREGVRRLGDGELRVLVVDDRQLVELDPGSTREAVRARVESGADRDDARALVPAQLLAQEIVDDSAADGVADGGHPVGAEGLVDLHRALVHEALRVDVADDGRHAHGVVHADAAAVVGRSGNRVHVISAHHPAGTTVAASTRPGRSTSR
jgi:hypothetical protein